MSGPSESPTAAIDVSVRDFDNHDDLRFIPGSEAVQYEDLCEITYDGFEKDADHFAVQFYINSTPGKGSLVKRIWNRGTYAAWAQDGDLRLYARFLPRNTAPTEASASIAASASTAADNRDATSTAIAADNRDAISNTHRTIEPKPSTPQSSAAIVRQGSPGKNKANAHSDIAIQAAGNNDASSTVQEECDPNASSLQSSAAVVRQGTPGENNSNVHGGAEHRSPPRTAQDILSEIPPTAQSSAAVATPESPDEPRGLKRKQGDRDTSLPTGAAPASASREVELALSWHEQTGGLCEGWNPLLLMVKTDTKYEEFDARVKKLIDDILKANPGMAPAKPLLRSYINLRSITEGAERYWSEGEELNVYLSEDQTKIIGSVGVYLCRPSLTKILGPYAHIGDVFGPLHWAAVPMHDKDNLSKARYRHYSKDREVVVGCTRQRIGRNKAPNVVLAKFADDYHGRNVRVFWIAPTDQDGNKMATNDHGSHSLRTVAVTEIDWSRPEFRGVRGAALRPAIAAVQDAIWHQQELVEAQYDVETAGDEDGSQMGNSEGVTADDGEH